MRFPLLGVFAGALIGKVQKMSLASAFIYREIYAEEEPGMHVCTSARTICLEFALDKSYIICSI